VLLYRSPVSPWDNDEILRAELFSSERLEQHAASLAAAQQVTRKRSMRRSLNARLKDNESALLAAYRTSARLRARGVPSPRPPNGCSTIIIWSKSRYARSAPTFRRGSTSIAAPRGRSVHRLSACIRHAWAVIAPQRQPLRPGVAAAFRASVPARATAHHRELWAIAITLRIVLVENLRRAASRIVSSRAHAKMRTPWPIGLLGVNGYAFEPDALMRRDTPDGFAPAFVVQLVCGCAIRIRIPRPHADGWTRA